MYKTELIYYFSPLYVATFVYLVRKLREYQWGWVRNNSTLKGKLFIITGANTGLGYETAKALVKREGTVIIACRSLIRANEAISRIRQKTANGTLSALELDLASFDSIKSFASEIKTNYPNFDCLINNAGMAIQTKQYTKENFEIHFGVNHLGHFLLVDLLKDYILRNNSRIVVVSSKMHERGKIDLDHLGKYSNDERPQRTNPYYNNSKLANFYFARELYRQGFDCHVLCPGLCHTDFFRDYNPRWYHYILFSPIVWLMLRSAEQGAQNIIYCATDNLNTTEKNPLAGYYVRDVKQSKSKFRFDDQVSKTLWDESAKMCAQHNK